MREIAVSHRAMRRGSVLPEDPRSVRDFKKPRDTLKAKFRNGAQFLTISYPSTISRLVEGELLRRNEYDVVNCSFRT